MSTSRRLSRCAAGMGALLCIALMPSRSAAQPHTEAAGGYVLRASTVSTQNLPPRVLEQHGIPTDPHTAVLNVVVQHSEGNLSRHVRADVVAHARNLYGVKTDVDMREVMENGFVSYLGVYKFLPREVLDFHVTARPEASGQTLTLTFRDRLRRR